MLTHDLVPAQSICSQEELEALLSKYGTSKKKLPVISANDPVVKELGAAEGDVIKVERNYPVAEAYYRQVK